MNAEDFPDQASLDQFLMDLEDALRDFQTENQNDPELPTMPNVQPEVVANTELDNPGSKCARFVSRPR